MPPKEKLIEQEPTSVKSKKTQEIFTKIKEPSEEIIVSSSPEPVQSIPKLTEKQICIGILYFNVWWKRFYKGKSKKEDSKEKIWYEFVHDCVQKDKKRAIIFQVIEFLCLTNEKGYERIEHWLNYAKAFFFNPPPPYL